MASRSSSLVCHRWRSRTLFCSRAKNDSMAALSAQAPVRPIEPTRALLRSSRTNFFERNWLPRSKCTTVPYERRSSIALLRPATASDAFMPGIHGVANDAPGERVLHGTEVELALIGRVLGDVGEPQLVGSLRAEARRTRSSWTGSPGLGRRPFLRARTEMMPWALHRRCTRFSLTLISCSEASSSAMNRYPNTGSSAWMSQDLPDGARADPDPELTKLPLDPHAPPSGVLLSETGDEIDGPGIKSWLPRSSPSVCPLPSHELAVPSKERLRRDHERGPALPGERPARRGQKGSIGSRSSGRWTERRRTFTWWRRTAFSSWSCDMLPRPVSTPTRRTSTR